MRKISLFTIIATVLILVFAIVNADARTTRITVKPVETKDVSIEGTFQKLIVDYEDSHEEIYFIENEKEKIRVFPKDEHLYLLGQNVKVTGQDKDGGISANSISQSRNLRQTNVREFEASLGPGYISTLGNQRLLVLLVNPSDSITSPISVEEAKDKIFNVNNPDSTNSYFREVSYNKMFFSGDVHGWVTIPYTKEQICNLQTRGPLKIEQAIINQTQNEVDYRKYSRVLIVYSNNCGSLYGSSFIAPFTYSTNNGNVRLTFSEVYSLPRLSDSTSNHELGHNLGLMHANAINCGPEFIKNPVNCQKIRGGDLYDTIGWSSRKAHFNIHNKLFLKWVDEEQVLNNPGEGTYTITPIETRFGVKGIKIPSAYGFSYFIEYRRPIGFDNYTLSKSAQDAFDGAFVRINWDSSPLVPKKNNETYLIDFIPTDTNEERMVLKKEQVFTDSLSGFSLRVLDFNEENLTINIDYL